MADCNTANRLLQHPQIMLRQLPLHARRLGRHCQLQALVLGQGAFEVIGVHLRQVPLVGCANIGTAAQADQAIDVTAQYLFALRARLRSLHHGGMGKERFSLLEVLHQLLQRRAPDKVRREFAYRPLRNVQPPALFPPQRCVQIKRHAHPGLDGRLKQMLGERGQWLKLPGQGRQPPLAGEMRPDLGAQVLYLQAAGILQPSGQALGSEFSIGILHAGVSFSLCHGRFPGWVTTDNLPTHHRQRQWESPPFSLPCPWPESAHGTGQGCSRTTCETPCRTNCHRQSQGARQFPPWAPRPGSTTQWPAHAGRYP
ncbi:hypothetical protein D3C76_790470 [compost metagenome]